MADATYKSHSQPDNSYEDWNKADLRYFLELLILHTVPACSLKNLQQ